MSEGAGMPIVVRLDVMLARRKMRSRELDAVRNKVDPRTLEEIDRVTRRLMNPVVAGLVGVRVVSKTVRWALAIPKEKVVPADVVYVPVPRDQVGTVAAML